MVSRASSAFGGGVVGIATVVADVLTQCPLVISDEVEKLGGGHCLQGTAVDGDKGVWGHEDTVREELEVAVIRVGVVDGGGESGVVHVFPSSASVRHGGVKLALVMTVVSVNIIKEGDKAVSGRVGLDVPKLLLIYEGGEVRVGPSEDEAFTEQAGDRGDDDESVVTEGLR
ncbi:hypothetical protein E2C01_062061 [Portunus trituberculatus]|uniref:Uncharacterized protein n=1 Tax=Portunus trituberculatus TaxID=210409 RepID=A0A5B7HE35_PORTR|nr:hypothetical protein [Portunus trituberculatus]